MKRIKLHLSACLLLAGSAAFVSSCQDYEPFSEERVQDVAYNREFVRQFGDIDPHQNWDLFGQLVKGSCGASTRGTTAFSATKLSDPVEVTLEESSDFAKVMPELNVATHDYSATNLGRVTENFTSTARSFIMTPLYYWTSHDDDKIGIYWYTDENDTNGELVSDNEGNNHYIVRNEIFHVKFDKTQDWSLTPNYYNPIGVKKKNLYFPVNTTDFDFDALITASTTSSNASNYKNEFKLAESKDPNQYGYTGQFTDGEYIYRKKGTTNYYKFYWGTNYSKVPDAIPQDLADDLMLFNPDLVITDANAMTVWYEGQTPTTLGAGFLARVESSPTYVQGDNITTESFFYYDINGHVCENPGKSDVLYSYPIKVVIPDNVTSFGFYLTNGSGTQYSESKLNARYVFNAPKGEIPVSYISTFDMKDVDPVKYTESTRYLCFEDWFPTGTDNTSDFDLNDCVFKLVLEGGSIVDHDNVTENAILVCEDLAQFDFDFNDVVLDLTYTSGKTRKYRDTNGDGNYDEVTVTDDGTELKVTAMAAGGAYESDICFQMPNPLSETGIETKAWHEVLSLDYVTGEEVSSSEIHYLLGGTSKGDNNDIMNAGATMTYLSGKSITFDGNALERFSLDNLGDYPTHLSKIFANGFIVVTCKHDGTARAITSNGAYAEGVAPQMMLLPDYFEWPQEGIYISDAYNGFNEWVQDITQTDWIFTSQDDQIVTERGDFSSLFENPGEVVSTTPLTVTNGQTFTYKDKNGVETHYPNCAKVSFADITADNAAYAELKVTFDKKPTGETYLDFEGGEQLLEDKVGSVTERTYHLSTTNLRKAITTGAIYFMARGGAEVKISSAVLTIKR